MAVETFIQTPISFHLAVRSITPSAAMASTFDGDDLVSSFGCEACFVLKLVNAVGIVQNNFATSLRLRMRTSRQHNTFISGGRVLNVN
jgi:hypothetical protein